MYSFVVQFSKNGVRVETIIRIDDEYLIDAARDVMLTETGIDINMAEWKPYIELT